MSGLDETRARVDAIDRALVKLLAERRAAVAQAAELKRALGLAAIDPDRERELAGRWTATAEAEGIPPDLALAVLDTILDASRRHVQALLA